MAEVVKKKQKKCSSIQGSVDIGEDRISGLPDSLIHHILSFLEMKYVIKTSLLSRRWRYLWASVPVLDFGEWRSDDLDVTESIGLSLMLYEGRKIRRFSVDLDRKVRTYHIDSWIRFALRHDVEELDISSYDSVEAGGSDKIYKLRHRVLDCGSLRVLKLGCCALNFRASYSLRSLTTLHLYWTKLTALDTSNCPLLQDLIIEDCTNTLKVLNIYAPNKKLRYFKILEGEAMDRSSGLTLCAPYLLFIEFSGDIRLFYNVKNLSSIKSARLDFYNMDEYCSNYDGTQLVELLKNLSHAKTLKLCRSPIQMLAYRESKNLKTPHLSATCLELESNLTKSELPGIASLLRSCQCLETLIVNIDKNWHLYENDRFDALKSWEILELALSAPLQLKTVMIRNFLKSESDRLSHEQVPIPNMDEFLENWADEIKLVKILLERCKILDKMIISTMKMPPWSLKSELLLRLVTKLLAFPRASMLAYRESKNLKMPHLSATCLELESNLTKSELPGIASLPRSCQCLETLIVNIDKNWHLYENGRFDALKSWEILELALSAPLQLKTVMIRNFLKSESDRLSHEQVPIPNMDEFLENWADEIKLVKILLE